MNKFQATLAVIFLAGLSLAGCSGGPEPGTPEYTRAKIDESIDSIAANPRSTFFDTLVNLPHEEVNIAVLAALESRQDMIDDSRVPAYELLRLHNATTMAAGVQRMLIGLHDTLPVAGTSVMTLRTTPETNRQAVARGLDTLFMDTAIIDDIRTDVISILMQWRAFDSTHVGRLSRIFTDSTRGARLRRNAYAALLVPAGATRSLSLLNSIDTVGLVSALDALAGTMALITETKWPEADMKRVRQVALASLFHKEKVVRVAALDALRSIYGEDYDVTVNEKVVVNPEIVTALERMAQVEPDSTLRAQVKGDVGRLRR